MSKESASAFGMALLITVNGLKVYGELKKFERISESLSWVTADFFNNCGDRIYGFPRYVKGVFSLKTCTFGDASWLGSTVMLWLKSAQA